MIVYVSSNMTNPFLPASPSEVYDHPPFLQLLFPPDQESIVWTFELVPNKDLEEVEAFRATISPNTTGYPTFLTSGGSLYDETLIVIQDAQSRKL